MIVAVKYQQILILRTKQLLGFRLTTLKKPILISYSFCEISEVTLILDFQFFTGLAVKTISGVGKEPSLILILDR